MTTTTTHPETMLCSWILKSEENFPKLESAFLSNPYPSKVQVEELAKKTKFQEDHIETYFAIRRGDDPKTNKPSIMAKNSERIQQDQALTKQGLNVFQRCVPLRNRKSLEAELREVEQMEAYRIRLATAEVTKAILEAELHSKVQHYEIHTSELKQDNEERQKKIRLLECEVKFIGNSEKSLQKLLMGVGDDLRDKDQMYIKEISEILVFTEQCMKRGDRFEVELKERDKKIEELREHEQELAEDFLKMQKTKDQRIMELEAELKKKDLSIMTTIDENWRKMKSKNIQINKLELELKTNKDALRSKNAHITKLEAWLKKKDQTYQASRERIRDALQLQKVELAKRDRALEKSWDERWEALQSQNVKIAELKEELEKQDEDIYLFLKYLIKMKKEITELHSKDTEKKLDSEPGLSESPTWDMPDYIKSRQKEMMKDRKASELDSEDEKEIENRMEELEKEFEKSEVSKEVSELAKKLVTSGLEEAAKTFCLTVDESGCVQLTEKKPMLYEEPTRDSDSDSESSEFVILDMEDSGSEGDEQDSEIGALDTVADPEVSEDEDRDSVHLGTLVLTEEPLEELHWKQEEEKKDDW